MFSTAGLKTIGKRRFHRQPLGINTLLTWMKFQALGSSAATGQASTQALQVSQDDGRECGWSKWPMTVANPRRAKVNSVCFC
jgi:hypothetical protein